MVPRVAICPRYLGNHPEIWPSCFCTVNSFHLSQISTFQFQLSSRERLRCL
nr:hypothetical protein GZ18F2_52 [uncultured archaeon GZfos18F2]